MGAAFAEEIAAHGATTVTESVEGWKLLTGELAGAHTSTRR